jgi:hypothetical protein
MLAKKTVKNQITLPKKVVERFPDVEYFDVHVDNGNIILKPVIPNRIDEVHDKLAELGIAERDIRDAVRWARGSND